MLEIEGQRKVTISTSKSRKLDNFYVGNSQLLKYGNFPQLETWYLPRYEYDENFHHLQFGNWIIKTGQIIGTGDHRSAAPERNSLGHVERGGGVVVVA